MKDALTILLHVAAAIQLLVAMLNLLLPRILGWNDELARMPLLMREVFHVHAWFLSLTLVIFATLTWRFAGELAVRMTPLHGWLAACIGGFWAVRACIQVAYYSTTHWRGRRGPTSVHIALLVIYGGLAVLYGCCAFG